LPGNEGDDRGLRDHVVSGVQAGGSDGEGLVLCAEGHEFELGDQAGLAGLAAGGEGQILGTGAGDVDADVIDVSRHGKIAPHCHHDLGVVFALAGQRARECDQDENAAHGYFTPRQVMLAPLQGS
jgi:hypothetical protein